MLALFFPRADRFSTLWVDKNGSQGSAHLSLSDQKEQIVNICQNLLSKQDNNDRLTIYQTGPKCKKKEYFQYSAALRKKEPV